jgi:lipoprotein-anchoring transpeptidase ErfK/SrfK
MRIRRTLLTGSVATSLAGVLAATTWLGAETRANASEAQGVAPAAERPAAATPAPKSPLNPQATKHLALQVALDRAGFSPGEIDATAGANTEHAIRAFQRARGLAETGLDDWATVAALGEAYTSPLAEYVITERDVAGPFVPDAGEDMMALSTLDSLSYASPVESIAERFHCSPALLRRLNPAAAFIAGERLVVPNVEPFVVPTSADDKPSPAASAASVTVVVSEASRTLDVTGADGAVVFHAPVSMGGEKDPLPKGEWSIKGTAVMPKFHYNPELFWDADPSHAKATIAPGPNNPVGVVWIDLSKEHLGFHGTPEPSRIGRAQSHGCLRLTNWDAMRLAALVGPGAKVILR